jgi:hypothetical protein
MRMRKGKGYIALARINQAALDTMRWDDGGPSRRARRAESCWRDADTRLLVADT